MVLSVSFFFLDFFPAIGVQIGFKLDVKSIFYIQLQVSTFLMRVKKS